MNLQPLVGKPVLMVHGKETAAVIGDLHIGIESHLRWKGFHITSRTEQMLRDISVLSEQASRLILLGDVKHRVPGTTRQELEELPGFFRALCQAFDRVDLVKGNHDGNIEDHIDSDVHVHPPGGMVWGEAGFVHGHTWPSAPVMACPHLVMAHNHPTVMFHDGVGKRTSEPCWLRGSFQNGGSRYLQHPRSFMLMPAFNPILGGSPVNVEGESLLGPVMNSGMPDLDDARIYLLDGIQLGRRADLMVSGRMQRRRQRYEERSI